MSSWSKSKGHYVMGCIVMLLRICHGIVGLKNKYNNNVYRGKDKLDVVSKKFEDALLVVKELI